MGAEFWEEVRERATMLTLLGKAHFAEKYVRIHALQRAFARALPVCPALPVSPALFAAAAAAAAAAERLAVFLGSYCLTF